jgi:hypothetical protein
MKRFALGLLLAAVALPSSPAMAQQDRSWSDSQRGNEGRRGERSDRRDDQRNENARENAREDRRDNRQAQRRRQNAQAWQNYNRYDYNRYEPRYGNYQANRYYRDGRYYADRRLTNRDRIYRGSNGQYYCRRDDGTTGLIIGAIGGGLLGREIAANGSKTLGAILGGASGALIGRSIGRGGVRCN